MPSDQLIIQPTLSLPALILGGIYVLILLSGTLIASLLIIKSMRTPVRWTDRAA